MSILQDVGRGLRSEDPMQQPGSPLKSGRALKEQPGGLCLELTWLGETLMTMS